MELQFGTAIPFAEIKAVSDGWTVSGYCSTFGNVDHGNDVIARGAFDATLRSGRKVRFLFGHDSRQIVGTTQALHVDEKGLFGRFKISQTSLGRDIHTLLKDEAIDSFSIGYVPHEFEFDDQETRILKEIELLEVSLVAIPMNDLATVTGMKERLYGTSSDPPADDDESAAGNQPVEPVTREDFDALPEEEKIALWYDQGCPGEDATEEKAVWSAAFINDLPDSSFAVILGGGSKDGEGKTTPRSLRKLPHHGTGGAIDMAHLRNALSREPQTDMPDAAHAKAKSHLNGHMRSGGKADDADDHDTEHAGRDLAALEYAAHADAVLGDLDVFLSRAKDRAAVRRGQGRKLGTAFFEQLTLLRSRVEALLALKNEPTGDVPTDSLRRRLALTRRRAELDGILPIPKE